MVAGCLENTLGEYEKGAPVFECFNTAAAKARSSTEGYGNSGSRTRGRIGWGMVLMVGMGIMGAAMGTM